MKYQFSFLTVLPFKGPESFDQIADSFYVAPFIGFVIGCLAGLIAYFLSLVFSPLLTGILTLGFLLLITGLHHTDGVFDFGDGLMAHGEPERRLEVMKDLRIGVGGIGLGFIVLMTTFLSISEIIKLSSPLYSLLIPESFRVDTLLEFFLTVPLIIRSLIIAEVSAKLSMVVIAAAGKPAKKESMALTIIQRMKNKGKFAIGIILSLLFLVPFQWIGIIGLLVGILVALLINYISIKRFNGITGDVMGATNDITRVATLLSIIAITKIICPCALGFRIPI
ncbi:MAG: adenosylcobinamide-GDP ribazoletransferase [Promethearchaeota archaeon]